MSAGGSAPCHLLFRQGAQPPVTCRVDRGLRSPCPSCFAGREQSSLCRPIFSAGAFAPLPFCGFFGRGGAPASSWFFRQRRGSPPSSLFSLFPLFGRGGARALLPASCYGRGGAQAPPPCSLFPLFGRGGADDPSLLRVTSWLGV